MTANNPKEKAEEWVLTKTSWASDGLWLCEALDCKRAFLAGYRAALKWALEVVAAEPECPGDMPDEMWDSMKNNRDAATKFIQITVKLTKRNISNEIRKELGE